MFFVEQTRNSTCRPFHWFVCFSLIFVNVSSFATVQIDKSEQELAALSGMSEQIEMIPLSTISAFETILNTDQLPAIFEKLDPEELRTALSLSFTAEKFNRQLLSQLRNQFIVNVRK